MPRQNRFVLHNDTRKPLTLNIEPEGVHIPLGTGEEVIVLDEFTSSPVTIKLTNTDDGEPVVSIWPGDGDVRVEKDGVDVFDLIDKGVGV